MQDSAADSGDDRRRLELQLAEATRALSDLRAAHRLLESKHHDAEESLGALQPWRARALEYQQMAEAEKSRAQRGIEEALRGKQDLEDDVTRYQRLLKFVVVAQFCRESRLRRALAHTHENVSDMLLTTLEENVAAAAGNGDQTASGKGPRVTYKQMKKRKKEYLTTLLKARSKPREMVASLDEEVLKLAAPISDLLEKVRHWKATSESFFQRSIEVTSEKEQIEKAFRQTGAKVEGIKAILRRNQAEHDDLLQRNAELVRTNHALKAEVERLQARYGFASASSANGKSSKAAGEGKGKGDGSGAATKRLKEKSSPSSPVQSKHALAIEQLQLQQQAVLQENIARLQQHYDHLLESVGTLNDNLGMQQAGPLLSASQSRQSLGGGGGDEKQALESWPAPPPATNFTLSPPAHSRASLHQQQQMLSPHARYTIGSPQASTPRHLATYPSASRPAAQPTPPQQQLQHDQQRQLYQQALSQKPSRQSMGSSSASDANTIRRLEATANLFHLPQMLPQSPQPQTQRSIDTAHSAVLLNKSRAGAQSRR